MAKVSVSLDPDVRTELNRLVPAGRRSRVINEALRRELLRLKREEAASRLRRLRGAAATLTANEISAAVRSDRRRT